MPKKLLKLNLGCGNNKIKGYINIDTEKSCKPDLVHDFTSAPLPYKTGTVDEVVLFHTIEHLRKPLHGLILSEIHRVLKLKAKVYISYPNFWECATRWKNNYRGQRDFWHATLYGRQLYPSDYHVCAMDPTELMSLMEQIGFNGLRTRPEKTELYNSITVGFKGRNQSIAYEQLVLKSFREIGFKLK